MSLLNEIGKHYALLDRDGTILVNKNYLSNPDDIEFAPGALDGLKLLRDGGFRFILITNQSGIARGYFDERELVEIHERLKEMLRSENLDLEAIYYCPHGPGDHCRCRKPAAGMVHDAIGEIGFLPEAAVFIGDSKTDMEAARSAGIPGIWITHEERSESGFIIASDFYAAAQRALKLFA